MFANFLVSVPVGEEKVILLKQLVDSNFLDMIGVSQSSEPGSLQLKRQWFDIKNSLNQSAVEIIIASPGSVLCSWVRRSSLPGIAATQLRYRGADKRGRDG